MSDEREARALDERDRLVNAALDAGIMLSTAYGDGKGDLMPVSNVETLAKFHATMTEGSVVISREDAEVAEAAMAGLLELYEFKRQGLGRLWRKRGEVRLKEALDRIRAQLGEK